VLEKEFYRLDALIGTTKYSFQVTNLIAFALKLKKMSVAGHVSVAEYKLYKLTL